MPSLKSSRPWLMTGSIIARKPACGRSAAAPALKIRERIGAGKRPLQFEQPVRRGRASVADGLGRLTEQPSQVGLARPVRQKTSREVAVRRKGVLISPA